MSTEIKHDIFEVAITHQAATYAVDDLLGGKITITDADDQKHRSGSIKYITLIDLSSEGVDKVTNIKVTLFDSDPDSTTFTENAALDIDDADLPKVIAVVLLDDHYKWTDNGITQKLGLDIPFRLRDSNNLYACMRVKNATSGYNSTAELTLRIGIEED